MACDLTTGRAKGCYDNVAGVKAVYFSDDDLGAITYNVTDSDSITTLAGTPDFFQYDLKGSANTFDAVPRSITSIPFPSNIIFTISETY